MDDKQAMHAMSIDDAYHVERTLARGPSGVTELVSIDGNGPFVRKKIPSPLAQRNVWAALSACRVIVAACGSDVRAARPVRHRLRLRAGQHACANCGGKRAACTECGRAAYSTKFAKPCMELHQHGVIPPRHHAGQRHRGPGWRASHRFRHRAHPVRGKQPVHGIPRRLAPTDSPRLSNMALPKPTRVPTYSRWAGYSDSC